MRSHSHLCLAVALASALLFNQSAFAVGTNQTITTSTSSTTTVTPVVTTAATSSSASTAIENPPLFINRALNGLVLDFQRDGAFSDAVVRDAIRRVQPLLRNAPRNKRSTSSQNSSSSLTETQTQTLTQSLGTTLNQSTQTATLGKR